MVFIKACWGKRRPVRWIRARVWNRGQVWMAVLTVILSHTQTNNTLLHHYPNSGKVWAYGRKLTEKLVMPVTFMSWRRIEDELLSLSLPSHFTPYFGIPLSHFWLFPVTHLCPLSSFVRRESVQRFFFSLPVFLFPFLFSLFVPVLPATRLPMIRVLLLFLKVMAFPKCPVLCLCWHQMQ